jgi:hypothetical protein
VESGLDGVLRKGWNQEHGAECKKSSDPDIGRMAFDDVDGNNMANTFNSFLDFDSKDDYDKSNPSNVKEVI